MKIVLTRGNEHASVEGDDRLIKESICYQMSFERKVSEVIQAFYVIPDTGAQPGGEG